MRDIVSPLSGFGSPFGQRRRDTPTPPPAASGGTETVINPSAGEFYRVHTFLESGNLTVTQGGSARIRMAAGGGPGSGVIVQFGATGGGSAGDVIEQDVVLTSGTHEMVVGPGGSSIDDTAGGNSEALGLIALGGGRGASRERTSEVLSEATDGGGGQGSTSAISTDGAAHPTSFQGGAGLGSDIDGDLRSGGGGRGAAGDGEDATSIKGGDGGAGITSDISGVPETWGRGGGGGRRGVNAGAPNGASLTNNGSPGINPGDGGGGGSSEGTSTRGGDGADGRVVVRYQITEAEYNAEAV